VRVSAKADYALRAVVELAAAAASDVGPVTRERLAEAQEIPIKFLESVLLELKHVGIVRSHRGPLGGYSLGRDASDITIADVIRAVEGPLAHVRGERPELVKYQGSAAPLRDIWIAVRASLRALLEETTVADVVNRTLPATVIELTSAPEAWISLGRARARRNRASARRLEETPPATHHPVQRAEQQAIHDDPDSEDHEHRRQ
jgi:Rrf2 family protein